MTALAGFETLATGLDHPEGVGVGPDGLLYAGGEAGQIYRVGEEGAFDEIASTGGFIYGVTLDASGDVFACDFGNAAVMRISASGEVATYSNGTADRPMRVPNFAAFDGGGNLYVTDSGEWGEDDGVVYRIAPGGATEVWTEATARFPNGCCLTAGDEALLVVESHGRAVVRVPIEDDGRAGRPEPIVDLSGSQPDGIALAEDWTNVRRMLSAGSHLPDLAGGTRRGVRRRPRRGRPEPARERRVLGTEPGSARRLEPRGLEPRRRPGRRTGPPAPLPVHLTDG